MICFLLTLIPMIFRSKSIWSLNFLSFIHSSIYLFIHSFIHVLIYPSFIHSFIHVLMYSFILSFPHVTHVYNWAVTCVHVSVPLPPSNVSVSSSASSSLSLLITYPSNSGCTTFNISVQSSSPPQQITIPAPCSSTSTSVPLTDLVDDTYYTIFVTAIANYTSLTTTSIITSTSSWTGKIAAPISLLQ